MIRASLLPGAMHLIACFFGALIHAVFSSIVGTGMKFNATVVIVVSCLFVSSLTGCSPSKLRSGGQPNPTPSAQHDNKPAGESSATQTIPATSSSEQASEPATASSQVSGSSERQALMEAPHLVKTTVSFCIRKVSNGKL